MVWTDLEPEVRMRMQDGLDDAEQRRLCHEAGAGRPRLTTRLRRAAGSGLVRTGMKLLEAGRA
jgi:hypothetical protein